MDIYEFKQLIKDIGCDLFDFKDIEILSHCTDTCDYCLGNCTK